MDITGPSSYSPDAMRAIRAHKSAKAKFVPVESLDDE